MEGDEVVAVNGYSCKDVSYERLIGLVEHAGHYLDLDIVRCDRLSFQLQVALWSATDYKLACMFSVQIIDDALI